MMLSGIEIQKRMRPSFWQRVKFLLTKNRKFGQPDIVIRPFDKKYCGPNSYDVHLYNKLLFYKPGVELPPKNDDATTEITIPPGGIVLQPGDFCLGSIEEYLETFNLFFRIEGRSSVGRMGISIHSAAGSGDIGYCGRITLNIKNLSNNPVRLMPGMKIGQLHYETVSKNHKPYDGKYKGQTGATASRLYKDIENGTM